MYGLLGRSKWIEPQTVGRQGSASSGGGGAFQPTESTVGLPTVRLNLGCFNCGIDQAMLGIKKHLKNLGRVIAKGVHEQDLHLLNLCEVGYHKQGFDDSEKKEDEPSKAQKLVTKYLTPHYDAISCQAYMATWQAQEEPGHLTSVTLRLVAEPEVVALIGSMDPQLIIMVFEIAAAEHPSRCGCLISGNLHIRTPNGEKTKKATKNGS